ncbi:MAG: hypothetical protein ACNYVW_04065 [Methanosarcinales archaeon]
MTIFKITNGKAGRIPSISFKDERKEIQGVIGNDKNMIEFFGGCSTIQQSQE